MLVFQEEGKPKNPRKPSEQGEYQQKTQLTHGTGPESDQGRIGRRALTTAPTLLPGLLQSVPWFHSLFANICIRQINKVFTALKDFLSRYVEYLRDFPFSWLSPIRLKHNNHVHANENNYERSYILISGERYEDINDHRSYTRNLSSSV